MGKGESYEDYKEVKNPEPQGKTFNDSDAATLKPVKVTSPTAKKPQQLGDEPIRFPQSPSNISQSCSCDSPPQGGSARVLQAQLSPAPASCAAPKHTHMSTHKAHWEIRDVESCAAGRMFVMTGFGSEN